MLHQSNILILIIDKNGTGKMNFYKLLYFGLAIGITFLTACNSISVVRPAEYYIIESSQKIIATNTAPDVITTPQYNRVKNKVKVIAVRAPEKCSSNSLDSNAPIKSSTVISTTCGQEMSALERQLVKNGYRVISWKVIASRSQNMAALEIARLHKADLLLQINTLDRILDIPDETTVWTERFYHSNSNREKLGVATVSEKQANSMIKSSSTESQKKAKLNASATILGATIDASVTLVNSAESAWFYKWTKLAQPEEVKQTSLTSYVKCKNEKCWDWVITNNRRKPNESTVTGSSNAINAARYVKAGDKLYYMLLEDVIKNMITQLSK